MAITTSYSWIKGPTALLNDMFSAGSQFGPSVSGNLAGDRYFAAWSDPGSSHQVEGRLFGAGRTPLTSEFTVNNTANAGTVQFDPSVTALTNGNFVVVYNDFAADAGGDTRARFYSPDGNPIGSDFTIDASGSLDDTQPSVTALSNGNFVMSFTRGFGGNIGIRARVYDTDGNNLGLVTVDSDSGLSASSIAALSSGGFVVVWQDDTHDEVYFRRFQADGTPIDADSVLMDTAGSINQDIHVVGLPDGGFAVAYTDNGWGIDGTEITFRIYNADGTTRTDYIRANDVDFGGIESGDQNRPTITTMGDLIVVGWHDADTSSSRVQVFDAQGHAIGDNYYFNGQVIENELSGLANGQVANVWASSDSEGPGLNDSMRTNVAQFTRSHFGDGTDDLMTGVDDQLHERFFGGAGNDIMKGGGGTNEFFGGPGIDTVSYESASAGVTASLANPFINIGAAAGDVYASVEKLVGSAFDDTLVSALGTKGLSGGGGNDALVISVAGNLVVDGGAGDDTAVLPFNLNDYIVQDFGAMILVTGPDGLDKTLTSIEHLQFADATIVPADAANDGNLLFDTLYYLSRNGDVFRAGVNALEHFNSFGSHEGRDPNAYFDTSGYLAVNKHVAAAGMNSLEHYHQSGWKDGLDPSAAFDTKLYLLHNPDVAAAGIDPLQHFLQFGFAEGRQAYAAVGNTVGGFDAQYYLFHNPDVAAAGIDPLEHFNTFGWHEGRNPNGWFDTAGYLSHYADVAASGMNPFEHYMAFGWHEARDASAGFDTLGYLTANPDVAAAGINPLDHFLQFGIYEGRQVVNDSMWH
jgi:hypothetical protein